MAKRSKVEIQQRKFSSVVKELSKITGLSFRKIIRAEGGHVLSGAMNATRVGSKKKIIEHQMPINFKYERNKGKKEFGKIGEQWNYLGGRFSDQKWGELLGNRTKRTDRALENRGVSASQFYIMANLLKIKLPRPPKNQAITRSSHRKIRRFLRPREERKMSNRKYQLIFDTKIKGNRWTGSRGKRKFKSAGFLLTSKTKARANLFSRAVRKGFLNDIKFRTRYYPLIFK